MSLIEFAVKFQTAIVGTLGFAGVIITLFVNAKLARQNRTADITHKTEVLITGLVVELELCLSGLNQSWNLMQNVNAGRFYNVPIYSTSQIFEQNLDKLGLLKDETLRSVLNSHYGFEQYRNVALMSGELVNEGRSVRMNSEGITAMAQNFPELRTTFRNAIEALKRDRGDS